MYSTSSTVSFFWGGGGGEISRFKEELRRICTCELSCCPSSHVLIEGSRALVKHPAFLVITKPTFISEKCAHGKRMFSHVIDIVQYLM
eukprot:jgi/Botrbrau1/8726/Bobra.0090s0002.1